MFLCFQHHDEYDSKTSQRKNLTSSEVRFFREELDNALDRALTVRVHFGVIEIPAADPFGGHYLRTGRDGEAAEITVTPLPDGLKGFPRYHVSGLALFGTSREQGPNIGDLNFTAEMFEVGSLEHASTAPTQAHEVSIRFSDDALILDESGWFEQYGLGVNFIGTYQKIRPNSP